MTEHQKVGILLYVWLHFYAVISLPFAMCVMIALLATGVVLRLCGWRGQIE